MEPDTRCAFPARAVSLMCDTSVELGTIPAREQLALYSRLDASSRQ